MTNVLLQGDAMELKDRLIVAADFDPAKCGGTSGVREKVLNLTRALMGTGVYIKVNTVLRAIGYSLISELHELGVRVMADLKLNDIPNTLVNDAGHLNEFKPELLTVMASAGSEAIRRLRDELDPAIELLAVTVLTSIDDSECERIYGQKTLPTVDNLANIAACAAVNGFVSSGREVSVLRGSCGSHLTYNVPAIRPEWYRDPKDDQKRAVTPADAIKVGATRIIVGRPIVGVKPNDIGQPQSPAEAVEWTLKEIETALTQ